MHRWFNHGRLLCEIHELKSEFELRTQEAFLLTQSPLSTIALDLDADELVQCDNLLSIVHSRHESCTSVRNVIVRLVGRGVERPVTKVEKQLGPQTGVGWLRRDWLVDYVRLLFERLGG